MHSVRNIALSLFPGCAVKAKERSGEPVPTYDVWVRQPGAERGRRMLVVRFPTLHMSRPTIERI